MIRPIWCRAKAVTKMNGNDDTSLQTLLPDVKILHTISVEEIIRDKIRLHARSPDEDWDDSFFVGDLSEIVDRVKIWKRHLPDVTPFFAMKSNGNTSVVSLLAQLGCGFDCASKGEVEKALALNLNPSRIVYANTVKSSSHIEYAAANDVYYMTFDNEAELYKVKQLHPSARMIIRIIPIIPGSEAVPSLRNLSEKFGCDISQVGHLLEVAKGINVNVVGVSFHVGHEVNKVKAFDASISAARNIFDKAKALGFNDLHVLDIGGGYMYGEGPESFGEICSSIRAALARYFPPSMKVGVIAEPGCFLPCTAFTLVTNVTGYRIKDVNSDEHQTNGLPNGDENGCEMTDDVEVVYYINNGIHGSFLSTVFGCAFFSSQPVPLDKTKNSEPVYTSTLFGQTCNPADVIASKVVLPKLDVGDWLLFKEIGAYSIDTASEFNGFSKSHCYLYINEHAWEYACNQRRNKPFDLSQFSSGTI